MARYIHNFYEKAKFPLTEVEFIGENKEIYFSDDVYSSVAERLGLPKTEVKRCFDSYIQSVKDYILETDYLVYTLPFLGKLAMDSKALDLKSIEAKVYKFKDYKRYPTEKEQNIAREWGDLFYENSKRRVKKMKILLANLKESLRLNWFKTRRRSIIRISTILKRDAYWKNTKELIKVAREYNKSTYDYYKENTKIKISDLNIFKKKGKYI